MADRLHKPERRMAVISVFLLAAGTPFCWILFGAAAGLSFVAGGGLAALNLMWLYRTVAAVVHADAKGPRFRVLAGFFARLLLIPVCLYVMIRFLFLNVPAAVAGFTVFHCSVFVEGILEAFGSTPK